MSSLWDRTQVKKMVVHYLGAVGLGVVTDKARLLKAANPSGWDYPDYDFGILGDGTLISMRPLSVVGAHTQADRSKYEYGPNWWNKNSASVVLAYGDPAVDGPTQEQVTALAAFLIQWCHTQGATFDDIYPHFQVTQTDCPGAKSSQLGIDTGYLDWDSIEEAVRQGNARLAKVLSRPGEASAPVELPPVVVYFTEDDRPGAKYVAQKIGTSNIVLRSGFNPVPNEPFYIVGGAAMEGAVQNLTGETWADTTALVLKFLGGN